MLSRAPFVSKETAIMWKQETERIRVTRVTNERVNENETGRNLWKRWNR